ncbi:MAG: glycosyltransferase family 4 protein [bacterium]
MRIAQITSSVGWSGGAQQAFFLSKGLLDKGYEIKLICPPSSEIGQRAADAGIPVISLLMRQEYDIVAIIKLVKILRKNKIDILHAHHPKAHALALAASKIAKTPVFIYSRRVIFHVRKGIFSQIKYKSKRTDKIVAVSKGVKKILVDYGIAPSRIEVIYSGTDVAVFTPEVKGDSIRKEFAIHDDELLVALVGNYSYYKGHTFFLEAIPSILQKAKGVKFILVGRDTDSDELKGLVDNLDIANSTILAGFRRDVPLILAAADITVNASLQEGFAGTIRESLAMGKAVVATDVGGNPEMVYHKKNGLLVSAGNSQALSDAIVMLLNNSDLRKEMGKNGRKLVEEEFSVKHMVDKTESLYKELLFAKKVG